MKRKKPHITSYIKHLAVNGLSSILARIKSTFNLTGKCFEMPNVSYTSPLTAIPQPQQLIYIRCFGCVTQKETSLRFISPFFANCC